jgi:hypothetical protein
VLLVGPGDASDIVAHHLARDHPDLVVVMEDPQSRIRLARRRARRMGWGPVIGQVLFITLVMPLLRRSGGGRRHDILVESSLTATPFPGVHHVDSVNSAATVELLRHLDPPVVVVNGTRIIAKSVLASVDSPFINIHAGITPQFRGVHGGYWAMATGRPELVGTTVHLVDPGIDTGTVLAQARFHPADQDTIATYPYLHLAAGLPALSRMVAVAARGQVLEPTTEPATDESHLYTHPTIWGYLWRWIKHGVR